jgi:uncharacterized repeat protein (TIGR01451 family)
MRATGRRWTAAIGLVFIALVALPDLASAQAQSADMVVVTLSMSGGGVSAGGTTNLTMEFVNRGPANVAPGARAVVSFNQAVTASITSSPVSCSGGGRIVCNAGNLGQGNRIRVTATVRVGASAAGNLVATARASSSIGDPVPGNDQRQASLPISGTADLVLSQSISPNPPGAGGTVTVVMNVGNRGPSDARDTVLTVNVPAGASVASAAGCGGGGGRLTCNLGVVAAGGGKSVRVVYGLGGLPAGSQVTASASVRTSTRDSNNGNNSVSQTVTIGAASADVSISKSAAPNPASIGATVNFTMVVRNNGPSAARGVVVSDPLPSSLRLRSTQAPGSCNPVGLTVLCNVGNLAAGQSATVSISVTVLGSAAPGPVVNRVSVSSDSADRNSGNNAASISLRIATTPVRPTVSPTALPVVNPGTTTTIMGDLPPTGRSHVPIAVAWLLFAVGVLFIAGAYRGRRGLRR